MSYLYWYMKRIVLFSLAALLSGGINAQKLSEGKTQVSVERSKDGYVLHVTFGDISLKKGEGNWHQLSMPGAAKVLDAGAPELLYKAYSLLADGDVAVSVRNSVSAEFSGFDIQPSKGNLSRQQNPADVKAVAGAAYQQDAFYPAQIATVANEYMIRQAAGRALHIYPVQYNPVTHKLRVYTSMDIEVKTSHASKPVEVTGNKLWDNIYRKQFINYDLLNGSAAKSTYVAPTETGDMLIITPGQYITALQPFVEWKKERGIRCKVINLSTMTSGPDPDSIKARIAQEYQQNNNLNYVLLVGDDADLPAMQAMDLAGPSDAAYGYISGNDHYPDLLIGRFSANNLQELQPQIDKSIEYEKNPTSSQNWYTRAMGIASNEGPGDDNQMDWEHMAAIRQELLGASYNYVYEAYEGTHPVTDAPLDGAGDPNEQEVITAINSGVSLINYCGHGSSTSMATTGFSNWDVPSLTNTNGEWPFIVTVACVTGEFMYGQSLGEALMVASQNGQAYGMVGGFMSSINQYWDPPMEAQDIINAIVSGNDTNELYAAAAITAAGCMGMNDAYMGSGYDMTDTWIFFGDPSLQLRYDQSDTLTAIHADSIYFYQGATGVQLNKAYGTVVLMHNDTIYSVQTANNFSTGHSFAPLAAGDSLMVIATSPNTKPYYGKIRIVDTPIVAVAINELGTGGELLVYPNPANNTVLVKGVKETSNFICYDITGRVALQGRLTQADAGIDVSGLVPGSYILQIGEADKKVNLPLQIIR
jgi:gingipain R